MPAERPDAILFLPGLGDWFDQGVDGVARRMAISLDRNARTAGARFAIRQESRDEKYVSTEQLTRAAQVRTLVRQDGQQEAHMLDVYELDYRPVLTRNYQQENPALQALRLFRLLFFNLPRLLRATASPAKSGMEKAQFFFALLVLSLLIVYMALLLVSVVGVLGQAAGGAAKAANVAVPAISFSAAGAWVGAMQSLVILGALVQALWPKLREGVTLGAVSYCSAIEYLSYGERRQVIAGQFADLLEHIAEKGMYRRIYVVAYSFGTIIALDALFPPGLAPGERFKLIDGLVTVGCPFDIVRMLWPAYFSNRQAWPGRPERWINLYTPTDVLASNFRDDSLTGEAERGVETADGQTRRPENQPYPQGADQASPMAALMLSGLATHNGYWGREYESEVSCFTPIMLALYKDDAWLQ